MTLPVLRSAAAIAGVPLLMLLLLVLSGQAAAWPALLAAACVLLAAIGLAVLRVRDLRELTALLHRAGAGDTLSGAAHPGLLALSPQLMGELLRVIQLLDARQTELDRLRRAEESILERLPDPVVVLGPDRAVRRTNAAARAAFGAELSAVLRHPDLRGAIEKALAGRDEAPAQAAQVSVPVPVPREIYATVTTLRSPLAGGAGLLVVLSDRTRERAVERMRADFVANASHELRTPLASLMGFIDTLRGPAADDPPAQKRFLDIMAEQAGRMNRLIDDLLSLSRIELTEHQLPAERVDLDGLLARLLASFEIRLQQRRVTIDLAVEEALPPVTGDADQLEQVLQNLIDNALKYGREGGVVRVRAHRMPPGGKFPARPGVLVSVADDGPGIARQHLSRLTERFYRVDNGRSRAIGGTGLGLAIVKHVVNRHRGQLLIESEEGAGATFSVWLPA